MDGGGPLESGRRPDEGGSEGRGPIASEQQKNAPRDHAAEPPAEAEA